MQAAQLTGNIRNQKTDQVTADKKTIQDLQKAFTAFSEMSQHLTESYSQLENRVIELSGELASVSAQRLEELNEKEQIADKLESLLRLLPAGVIVLDNRGVIIQANPTAEKLLSGSLLSTSTGLLGLAWGRVIREAFAPKQTDYHEVSLKDGRLVKIETSPLDKKGQLILLTDQTETRALQSQVARQQRLTAMGQMVASLAHQVRTPLSAALLYAGNLKNPNLSTEKHDIFVDKLVGRLDHLERQIQDMLLFVKGECQLKDQLPIQAIIQLLQESAEGLPAQAFEKIRWPVTLPNVFIQCQADALISAFMNLINNALEASNNKATVHIDAVPKKDTLEISFSDEGPGMTEEQIHKIQEPFFTTKSHGTGLGIPVLMTTVKAHKGHVRIRSKVGVGSQFIISLPVVKQG
ncbi:sensor histidine kinase [Reinekea thalattae]|uniref:histidine kinase n=1 Tax=Reinekea thalattae TaxID=2593301 RepID=A0A5C8Z970_9GAMM|nr:ATP-binding protein [Reinekea thalattae]TXR53400.1 GHKL domain-containing protein [Reinekea thalattae]